MLRSRSTRCGGISNSDVSRKSQSREIQFFHKKCACARALPSVLMLSLEAMYEKGLK